MIEGGPRILIGGGGCGGMHTPLRLERLLPSGEATVMVADPRSYMTYQPLLAEAAAGILEPRHVVVSLRAVRAAPRSSRRPRAPASGLRGRAAGHRHRAAPPDVIPGSGRERR
jgi:hypothetical protein